MRMLAVLGVVCLAAHAADTPATRVAPFLTRNCVGCHNAKLQSGSLNLQALTAAPSIAANREQWERVAERADAGQMPPPGARRPDPADVAAFTATLKAEFDRIDRTAKPEPGRITARRLNRTEYNNTILDLVGIDIQPAAAFPPDDSGYGFDNIADVLTISPTLMEKYVAAAEKVARAAIYGPAPMKPTLVKHEPWYVDFSDSREVKTDYDLTGLSLPSALHVMHRFPVEGDYDIAGLLRGTRPDGSEPLQVAFWIDGKQVKVIDYPVPDGGEVSGVRREFRIHVPAGEHWLAASFLRVYEGLPAAYNGPNPSKRPPPQRRFGGVAPTNAEVPSAAPGAPAGGRGGRAGGGRGNAGGLPRQATTAFFVSNLEIVGPHNQKTGATEESRRKLYTCGHLDGNHGPACARTIVSNAARRAYRRPVTANEVATLTGLVALAQKEGDTFEEGLALALQKVLISPHFLFRIEQNRAGAAPVNDYELASRLSYFLWSSMPDDELLKLAAERRLSRPEVLNAQVARMLKDSKSARLVENFGGQWLQFRALESHLPDRKKFQQYTEYTRLSLAKETELFFANVIREDRGILDFLGARYTFLNQRLAEYYGIPGVTGTEFRKVDLTGTQRAGVLTHGSVLTVSSYANRTSPVLRGKWILENLLNSPPPPPPPDVPNIDEAAVGTTGSLRQQLEKHRENAVCASCHSRMDPLGFALENYDAIGQHRTKDGKFDIDSTGTFPDGRSFKGADGLSEILKSDANAFARGLTERMLTYALGRGLESYDRPTVNQIVTRLAADQYRFSRLILEIVNSTPFRMRRGDKS